MGRVRSALLALLAACCLAACGVPIDSPAPSEAEVLDYAALQCPNEGFEVVASEEVREVPQKVVYTLRSTERDLTFTATGEITEPVSGKFPSGPKPRVSCDYPSAVRDLYHDDVVTELSERVAGQGESGIVFSPGWPELYVRNYAQLEEALALLEEVDALYEPELAYNPAEWVRENASTSVAIRWFDGTLSAEDGDPMGWKQLGDVALYGELDAERDLEALASAYAQLIADGVAPADATLPERHLESLHRTAIDRIAVRGEEVPFGLGETSWGDATNPYQRDHISEGGGVVARWSDDQGRYLVRVNMDGTDPRERDEGGSWLVQQVAQLAGGSYEDDATGFSWEVGNVSGHMEYVGLENGRKVARLELNDRTSMVSCSSEEAGLSDAVAMPVEDFAALFGLTARVDEAEGIIHLE
ncbi:hypothetical protein ACULPM_00835 [Thermophilibacter sp. ZX-H3]|uniref:hypothetical protein n=1 Tax=unclassified Thermophilibacter TaxID=2847308 RepID=UPI004040AA82